MAFWHKEVDLTWSFAKQEWKTDWGKVMQGIAHDLFIYVETK